MAGKVIKRFFARLPALLNRKNHKDILYTGFSVKSDEEFDAFLQKRLQNPAKKQALDWLSQDTLVDETFSLLDLGCGPGVVPRMIIERTDLKERVAYTGVDVSENALQYGRSRLPDNYNLLCRDILKQGLPAGHFDVIMINEVLEHLPGYDQVVDSIIARNPKVFIMTSFAVLHGLKRDRILWNAEKQCFMNSYAYDKLFQYLRKKCECPIWVSDVDRLDYDRYWFPRKELLVWYLRLASQPVKYLEKK